MGSGLGGQFWVLEDDPPGERAQVYRAAVESWLGEVAPELLGGEPVHEATITVPSPGQVSISLVEFDSDGQFCAAAVGPGRFAFGTASEVVTELAGACADADWTAALIDALAREREWQSNRRSMLEVVRGAGEMFHVSAAVNRDSIRRHGLDWTHMGSAPGIAGSREPELEAVFLCEERNSVNFYLRMARVLCDVWAVDVTGYWLETGPHGWLIAPRTIGSDRLRLIESDVEPGDGFAVAPGTGTESWGDQDGVIVPNRAPGEHRDRG